MTIQWLVTLAAVLALQTAPAQEHTRSNVHETAHLRVTTSGGEHVTAGKPVTLKVDVAPKPKMHVYAPGQPDYIVVSLKLDADPAFTAGEPKFPKAETLFFAALNEKQLVYSHPFQITQDVTLAPGTKGPVTLRGTLRYQACDDKVCFIPTNVPVEWTLR